MSAYVVAGLAALVAVAAIVDLSVTTDEEQLSDFADSLTGSQADRGLDGMMSWVDTARMPLRVRHDGRTRSYDSNGDDLGLDSALQEVLAPFASERAEVVQRSVQVEGEHGRVAIRIRDEAGVHDALFTLTRNGQGWLLSAVRVL